MNRCSTYRTSTGFSLIELAVVLVIIGLMLGGLLVPLSTQMETDKRKETTSTLDAIREALIGYAIINNRLPCPDTNADGLANETCPGVSTQFTAGRLPFASLGISANDTWNRPWTYAVNRAYTTGTFSLSTSGAGPGRIRVSSVAGCGSALLADDVPALVISEGKSDLTASAREMENDLIDSCFVDAGYTQGATGFDDLLVWISTGALLNRYVSAGKTPSP